MLPHKLPAEGKRGGRHSPCLSVLVHITGLFWARASRRTFLCSLSPRSFPPLAMLSWTRLHPIINLDMFNTSDFLVVFNGFQCLNISKMSLWRFWFLVPPCPSALGIYIIHLPTSPLSQWCHETRPFLWEGIVPCVICSSVFQRAHLNTERFSGKQKI